MYSIIIPVYKAEKYLNQCIDSILAQTYEDFELILVDDGSPDNCPTICDEYALKDNRIKVIHKSNSGAHSARKEGLRNASGEYICFVDSDDYIDKHYLETFSNIIETYNPDVSVMDCMRFNDSTQTLLQNYADEGLYIGKKLDDIKKELIYSSKIKNINLGVITYALWNKCYKKDLIKKHLNDLYENIILGEDMAITMPLILCCKSVYVSKYVGYYYRNNPSSIVNTFRKDDFKNDKILINYLDKMMPSHSEQISFYLAYRMKNYLITSARATNSIKEFKSIIKDNFSKIEYGRIKSLNKQGFTFKDKVLFFFLKNKMYSLIWLIARIV
ncbi:MAG: glycosyltransferase [Clostridia bacterium]|nr:glycosyltransferase [Clostridia bacterium]